MTLEEIREREAVATPGPWRWRGHDDGNVELRARVNGGQRIVTTMRADPCIVEVGEDTYTSSIAITPSACPSCRKRYAAGEFSDGPPCEKLDNLNTVWLGDREAGFVRPANHWAIREVPYRADVVEVDHPDARFIEHAREDIPFLLERVTKLDNHLAPLLKARHDAVHNGALYRGGPIDKCALCEPVWRLLSPEAQRSVEPVLAL